MRSSRHALHARCQLADERIIAWTMESPTAGAMAMSRPPRHAGTLHNHTRNSVTAWSVRCAADAAGRMVDGRRTVACGRWAKHAASTLHAAGVCCRAVSNGMG